jgi:hypothetical protein
VLISDSTVSHHVYNKQPLVEAMYNPSYSTTASVSTVVQTRVAK